MQKIYFVYLILFYIIHHVRTSRVRLCVSTNDTEKLMPQCVFCQSRTLAKTLQFCTGSPDTSNVNVTYQQAKCLINICNRNQIPSELLIKQQQSNQFIEQVKKRPINKQPVFQYPTTATSNNIMNDNSDQDIDTEMNNGPISNSNELVINDQQESIINKPINIDNSANHQTVGSNMINGQNSINANMMSTINGHPSTNTNSNNWMLNTSPSPTNNKFIIKRKPTLFKFRFWHFFG